MFSPTKRTPGVLESLLPVAILVLLLIFSVQLFGDDVAGGPNQVALTIAAIIAGLFAWAQGNTWEHLQTSILNNINVAMQAILILLIIGGLIGTWILGGIVPALVVWGLKVLSPEIFLFASCVICCLVSLATGSSWSTAGTVGLALVGIGHTMGIHPGMTAGAIISGAYFGDKMSPLSETTNLAPAMVGTDLFTHIRHMIYTTLPSIILTLLIFFILGFFIDTTAFSDEKIRSVTNLLNDNFDTSLYILIPPVLVIWMVVKKIPAIPALLAGCLMGLLFAALFQEKAVETFLGENSTHSGIMASIKAGIMVMGNGFSIQTGTAEVDSILARGGMSSMLSTIWLVLSAMSFGGIMDGSGMLASIAKAVLKAVKGVGNLISATVGSAVFMNLTASDQYMTLIITGRMYKEAYQEANLQPQMLSRTLEDSGTITSVLVPWNTCGAFMASTLGVSTLVYLPFCFFNLINPFVAIIYGYSGYSVLYKPGFEPSKTIDDEKTTS